MSQIVSEQPPVAASRNPWPRVVLILGTLAILSLAGLWFLRELIRAPVTMVEQTASLVAKGGEQLRKVAEAFQQGTLRTEFLSQAVELSGTSRFQFATLKQVEVFKREESGSTAWGTIPLPKVVVQALAPVEYSYFLDLSAPWEFERDGQVIRVYAPGIEANTPAMDVSALTFYTLEGSIWRDEIAVRERLRGTLSESLQHRALENTRLVRELGRQRLATFVEKWLLEKFDDGSSYQIKVIFPDERPLSPKDTGRL